MEKGTSLSPIHREFGYEILRTDSETLLIDRGTWPLSYVMGILGALAVLLIVLGILVALGSADSHSDVPPVALFGSAAVLGLAVGVIWRAYRRRRDLPLSKVVDGLVVDSNTGMLRDRSGDTLARLDSVHVSVRIDWWWTRALMRLVVLTWPGGKRVVFRSASRRKIREVMQTLQGLGISKPS